MPPANNNNANVAANNVAVNANQNDVLRIERYIDNIDTRLRDVSESVAAIASSLEYLNKLDNKIRELETSLKDAQIAIHHNKLVIDMIKWSVALIVPTMLSVFGALIIDFFNRGGL